MARHQGHGDDTVETHLPQLLDVTLVLQDAAERGVRTFSIEFGEPQCQQGTSVGHKTLEPIELMAVAHALIGE